MTQSNSQLWAVSLLQMICSLFQWNWKEPLPAPQRQSAQKTDMNVFLLLTIQAMCFWPDNQTELAVSCLVHPCVHLIVITFVSLSRLVKSAELDGSFMPLERIQVHRQHSFRALQLHLVGCCCDNSPTLMEKWCVCGRRVEGPICWKNAKGFFIERGGLNREQKRYIQTERLNSALDCVDIFILKSLTAGMHLKLS